MPQYNFACNNCKNLETMTMSISEFLSYKNKKVECKECKKGILTRQINTVSSKIDRSAEELVQQSKDEIRRTVDKIKSGDERTIRDIYGDKPNQYKQRKI